MKIFRYVKMIAIIFSMAMLISNMPVCTSYAAEKIDEQQDDGVSPCYSYTGYVTTTLFFVDGSAMCDTYVEGFYNLTTKITITQTLQRKSGSSWVDVWSWTNTENYWYYSYTNYNYPLIDGATYRVKSYIKTYSGSSYETIYSYSSEKTYSE